jgi:GNAT superfamily N-acetyltransferase
MPLFSDAKLSERLEALAAAELRRFVDAARVVHPHSDARLIEVAGGVAVYLGEGSPVNEWTGMGHGVPVWESDVEAVERFFAANGARALAIVSPLTGQSLVASLAARGWTADGFENVLVREYEHAESLPVPEGVDIVVADDDELRAMWVHAAAVGFSAPLAPLPAQFALGRIVAARPDAQLLLAFIDGAVAGTGEVSFEGGVAWLSADATLPPFRRRGVQRALQLARLAMGAEAGCDLAVSEALPGSPSQRNMERLGFRVAYTRVDLLAPAPAE